ncbi:flippase [Erwiniaceae bacterium BAC15a-03b]|uniref:Flippase n=1 Tax=Winslowiella arboricola TaxID=2978220 RepID=A0A9J6PVJ5_9GAMM|nr:flippase [Winslowiella arboricola]MCU5774289.1 flippase [Winslowiella arboricola]MCU5778836.1 flippase [Winslowiella arboricola]
MEKNLLKNIMSLAAVQGGNYIIPLITLPYLVKTLGPYSYGLLGFSLALIQYFNVLINYGFNLSATQKIALVSHDKNEVSKIFWNVIACQVILVIVSFLIIIISIEFSSFLQEQWSILFACMGLLLGNVLFPVWLFQGKERMTLSSLVNIISRLLTIPLVFIFVDEPGDAWIAALIMSAASILGGIFSIIILIKEKWIVWKKVNLSVAIKEFNDGWYLFLSTAAINIYTSSITVLLGIICGPVVVGYFVAADKLRLAAQGLIIPVSQACYPRVVSLLSKNKKEGIAFIRKLLVFQGGLGVLISICIFFSSPYIINFLYGSNYIPSISTLQILSLCPFLVGISNILGIHTMSALGFKKQFFNILLMASSICIVTLYPLSKFYLETGAAITVVLSEALVTILMISFINNRKILH